MDELLELKSERLVFLLKEIIELFVEALGRNPFIELEKSLKIVEQRNYNQYPSIKKKIKGVFMVSYGGKFKNAAEIDKKLDEIYSILSDVIK